MSDDLITSTLNGHVLHIRMNRVAKKNALDYAMYQGLADAFAAAAENSQARVVLITGDDKTFCSGNDISDFLNGKPMDDTHPLPRFMRLLANFPKPDVAGVCGPAIGIGVTMLLHCDLIYAGESARFQFPFVNIGICPEFGSTLLLPAMLGHPRAAELLLLGEMFSAEKAREAGIVNAVLADADTLAHAAAQAEKLAAKAPNALRVSKALMKRWPQELLQQVIATENQTFVPMLKMPESLEALNAFMEKRKPDFSRFE